MKPIIFFSVLFLSACFCNGQSNEVSTEHQNIIRASQDWPKKTTSGQADYYWADDALVMGPGQPLIDGKKNVDAMIKEFFKMPGFKMTWDPVPAKIFISSTGDMAYLIANNEMSMTDSTGKIKTIRNKAFQVWKKDSGNHWKAAASVMYPE